jgi:hypothetical protein
MKRALLVIPALAAALLAGCVVVPAPGGPASYGEPVLVAPPPPRVEYIGPPPVTGYIWLGGYWNWSGGRHAWVPGRWAAPRPGYVWVPHRWDRDGDHWRQRGGYWQEQRGRGPDYRGRDRRDQHG